MKIKLFLILLATCLLSVISLHAKTPAFPGAEGYGKYTTGGRGGTVYFVNTIDDSNEGIGNEGSLRWCINRSGARTILFRVSGTIVLNSSLRITSPDVTVVGQSAPGDGICIAGYPVNIDADNVIIRYLRFRMGNEKDISSDGADALGGRFHSNIIIDHCSVSWSTDECASFYQNSNFTMQWCLVSESLNMGGHSKGEHGYGAIWGGFGASFHHNLLAHHKSRVPRLGPGSQTTPDNELVDIRNNVYYNYEGAGCYGGEAMHANIVNNYYKPGPAGRTLSLIQKGRIIAIDKKTDNSFPKIKNVWGDFYISGNYVVGVPSATRDNWTFGVYNQIQQRYNITWAEKDSIRLRAPLPTELVTTHSAQNAYRQVLRYAGCSLHRDSIDIRIINETETNTAAFAGKKASLPGIIDSQNDLRPTGATANWSAWNYLWQTVQPKDANSDGIPDAWFVANVPAGKTAKDINTKGYTYLEMYLNSLVEHITNSQNGNAINSRHK